jgi:predicted small secreted protein
LSADIKRKGAFEMKNGKFIALGVVLVVLLALKLVLAGCDTGTGGGSDLDGTTWVGSGGFLNGATLTFNYPNYAIVSTELNETGTYTVSGTTVTLTETGGDTLTGIISGNTLTVNFTIPDIGTMSQKFTKKS